LNLNNDYDLLLNLCNSIVFFGETVFLIVFMEQKKWWFSDFDSNNKFGKL